MEKNAEKSDAISRMRARLERRSPKGGRATAKIYEGALGLFLRRMGLTADDFLARVEDGSVNPVKAANDYIDYLHDKGSSPSTIKIHVTAIKKLVEVNSDRTFNWKKAELPKARRVEEDKVPTKEIIRKVLLHADPMERALALVAASSGMREETLSLLAMEDLDLETFPDIGVMKVPAEKSKESVKYATFISPEAREALEAYLRDRGSPDAKDPVFATRFREFYARPDKLAKRWLTPLEKAGLGEKSRTWRNYRFHTLRKFFRTALEYAGVSKSFRERLLGHAGEYLDSSYFGPEFDKLAEQYRLAIPHLTIAEQARPAKEAALEAMRAVARTYGLDPMKLRIEKLSDRATPEEEEAMLTREIGIRRLGEGAPRGREQRVVAEGELEGLLAGGWRFVSALNNGSGRVVVERQA